MRRTFSDGRLVVTFLAMEWSVLRYGDMSCLDHSNFSMPCRGAEGESKKIGRKKITKSPEWVDCIL